MILSNFPEIKTKNFNSDLWYLYLAKLGMILPDAHFLTRTQTKEVIIHWPPKFLLENIWKSYRFLRSWLETQEAVI